MVAGLGVSLSECGQPRSLAPGGGRPERARFAYPAPRDPEPYRQRFGRVEFDQDFSGLVIGAADLARPLATADPQAAALIARLIDGRSSVLAESMVDEVTALIERMLPSGDCTVQRAAQMLGVDRRTVHRRLAMEGATFTGLVDRARKVVAAEALKRGGRQLAEVAELLGFSSLSTFSRWFHRAHGTSARNYRKAT